MTVGKASALAAGFVGAIALGVAIGPTVHDKWFGSHATSNVAATENAPAPAVETPTTPTPAPKRAVTRKRTEPATIATARTAPVGSVSSVPVSMWEPDVRDRVQKVLNRGAQLDVAAEDFQDAEDFVTVAHAARNTGVPFMVLKDRVLNQGQTLAQAIHESKPELDAKGEVVRAREAARSDLTS
jgi:hypothetical protein